MTYLVTLNPDTDYARTKVVSDDNIDRVIRNSFPPYGRLADGQAIMIRRADYMDINDGVVTLSGRAVGHLTVIEGGKDG
jgi:hypothetical protein